MVNTSACTAEHRLLQRLQYIPETRTQKFRSLTQNTSSSSTSKNTSSCFGLGRLSLAKLWLLSVLLLVTIAASSWPTGTSAAPRVARGLHLNLPHRHSSTEPAPSSTPSTSASTPTSVHVHRRSVRKAKEPQFLLMNQTKGVTSCKSMKVNTSKVAKLRDALMFAQDHKDSVICTTEDWLQNFYKESSIGIAMNNVKGCIDLEHPLKDRVSKVNFTAEGKFVYKGAVGSLEEEMPKIVETLFVLHTLLNTTEYIDNHKECTFRHILNSVRITRNWAVELMEQQQCNAKEVIHYHKNIPRLPFFIALETIKVLTVLEYTYEQLVNNMLKG
ncbi:uncharacterized protein [Drosophila kikkawai]|uniref:Uncharacterized protein n=1 Tax=Drosophila kikkawai TaxID=30033 RepID=A0A6P4JIY7_DROKI|nr:uncharacterized protein LOC108083346 [Drosophila kikkawai]